MVSTVIAVLLGIAAVRASPTSASKQAITPLTTSQIDALTPYAYFAEAAYCLPSTTMSWTCGAACANTKGFKPVASGGDGNGIQYWYVGYDPSLETVIVGHQGTNISEIKAVATDVNIILGNLYPWLFPGLSSPIEVHSGFRDEQAKTASDILSSVQKAMSQHRTTSVTMVGHSLGAAISLLDSVYLPLHLPHTTKFKTILYGLPRVGNQAFANYVDANLHVTHINNLKDPIPTVPETFLGYVHPAGEVHIRETGEWAACPGQDNPSRECIVGDVPSIFVSNPLNHRGPYNGVEMVCSP